MARKILIGLITFYQRYLSPIKNALMGAPEGCCRFNPTCSQYTITALTRFGIFKGSWLALKRILRCHPWGGFGEDPVPKKCEHHSLPNQDH